jgi:transposase InsO family protein
METSERMKMLEKLQCRAGCVNPCERNTLYESVSDARASLGRYLDFDNSRRRHSSLGARTPERAYLDHLPQILAA